jgi:DNA-directed RNA polymerase specialized sigma24 family protein
MGVFWMTMAAENSYQLSAPEGITAEKVLEAHLAATILQAALARLRGEFQSEGKGHLFAALQVFLLGREDAPYLQVADALSLSVGALKTAIHRLRGRYRHRCAKKWPAQSRRPRRSTRNFAFFGPR